MNRLVRNLVLVCCLTTTGTANALTCSIGAVSALSFGSYNVFSGTPLDTVGSVTYRCDDVGLNDTIVIRLSRGSSASYLPRTLTQGGYVLDYNLYLDASRISVWGDGSSGTSQYGPIVPANGTDTTVNIYGRTPAGQNARAGPYSDTIIVTFLF